MATYENDSYTSKGVGTAGLTLGVIGTALASGVLNGNGLGGLFGNQNPAGRTTQTWVKDVLDLPHMMDYDIRHGRIYI